MLSKPFKTQPVVSLIRFSKKEYTAKQFRELGNNRDKLSMLLRAPHELFLTIG